MNCKNKKMKALISCDEYIYSYNGNYYVREFGKVLFNRYLNVFETVRLVLRTKIVASPEELSTFNILLDNSRIEVIEIPFFQGPKEYAKKYFSVQRVIKSSYRDCDIAILRLPSTIGFKCLKYLKNKIPYAVEIVANPIELSNNTDNLLHKFLFKKMHNQQVIACKDAIGASYVTKSTLQKIYPNNKINSYYSSIELPESFFVNERKIINKDKYILCHSALHINSDLKGHDTVIRVVEYITKKGYNVECRFAGHGVFVNKFKLLAESLGVLEKIKFAGLLNQQQLFDFYKESDIMVYPSSSEGLPRVMIEALATGLPCIASPVGGIPELIDKDLLFDKNDISGFGDKIIEMISNIDFYKKCNNEAFEKSLEYSKEKLTQKRSNFYSKLKEKVNANNTK